MKKHLRQLIKILDQEIDLHTHLQEWLQEETEGIGDLPGSELLKIQGSKIQCSMKIKELEQERIRVVQQLANAFEQDSEKLTLRVIIQHAPVYFADELQQRFDHLNAIITKIQNTAEVNQRLAQARLKPIEASLKFLKSLQVRQQTYSESGVLQNNASTVSRRSI